MGGLKRKKPRKTRKGKEKKKVETYCGAAEPEVPYKGLLWVSRLVAGTFDNAALAPEL